MYKLLFALSFILTLTTACNTSQYDVYVINSTGQELKISYKSKIHIDGVIEKIIILEDTERRLIISTHSIDSESIISGPESKQCHLVADYVMAFLQDTIPSSNKWCTDKVKFEIVDIGQGEFAIEYLKEDFDHNTYQGK